MPRLVRVIGLASLALAGAAGFAHANLLVNGSFEKGDDPQLYVLTPASPPHIFGWSVGPANVDWVGPQWSASHGTRSLDLNGSAAGSVRQTFGSQAGTRYTLDFDLSGNPGCGTGNVTLDVEVYDGPSPGTPFFTQSFNFTIAASQTEESMRWKHQSLCFDAESAVTTLVFQSTKIGVCGPALDHVVLRDACCSGGSCHADLRGTVFHDLDRDGVLDPGEPLIPGVPITVDGAPRAVTDSSGAYELEGLAAGSRTVRTVTPPGWVLTTATSDEQARSIAGTDDPADADFGWRRATPESCASVPAGAGAGCSARAFVPRVRSFVAGRPTRTLPAFVCNLDSVPFARAFRWTLGAAADSAPRFLPAAGTTAVARRACVGLRLPVGAIEAPAGLPAGSGVSFQLTALDTASARAVFATGRLVRSASWRITAPDGITQVPDDGSALLAFHIGAPASGTFYYRIHSIAAPGTPERVRLNGATPGTAAAGGVEIAAGDSAVIAVLVSYAPGSTFVPFDQVVLDADLDGNGTLEEAEAVAVAPGSALFAGVTDEPAPLRLRAAPNPFHSRIDIEFSLAHSGLARVDVFDLAGRRLRVVQRGRLAAGPHRVEWDGLDAAGRPCPGLSFVRMQGPDGTVTARVVRR